VLFVPFVAKLVGACCDVLGNYFFDGLADFLCAFDRLVTNLFGAVNRFLSYLLLVETVLSLTSSALSPTSLPTSSPFVCDLFFFCFFVAGTSMLFN
jgi:hypothetical protein